MKNWCIKICLLLCLIFLPTYTSAELVGEELQMEVDTFIHINDILRIDISEQIPAYEEELEQENLIFEWSVTGKPTIEGPKIEESFEESGDKEINLNIFTEIEEQKTLITNIEFSVFVYEKSLPFIFSQSVTQGEKEDFLQLGKNSGVYIHDVLQVREADIYAEDILWKLQQYASTESGRSNYIGIWGEKDFLFSVISKINREQQNTETPRKMNFLLLSAFNGSILEWYLGNLLTSKSYIENTLILSDSLVFQVTKNPIDIEALKSQLLQNQYPFIDVDTSGEVQPYFFISRFINTLSNTWVNTGDIYILIMIPLLLTLISFMKHFVGVSPIGIALPLFLSILFYQIGLGFTFIVLVSLFFINLWVSQAVNKYNLLYTPKISFLMSINIICFFIILEAVLRLGLLTLQLTDIVYIFIFIIIAERLIILVIGKEIREYRKNLLGTIFIAFLGYLMMTIGSLQVIILAYPELIIFLVPINFMIGRFTGLRVTEYLRFKEIIKNIEEE